MLAGSGVDVTPSTKAREVLAAFVDHELDLLASGESGTRAIHHKAEHREALERTARGSLEHLKLDPVASQAREWMVDERVWGAMVEILQASGIVWTAVNDQLCYRHDRVRDHLFAEAMRAMLSRGNACSALTDPYFANVSAEALVRLGTPQDVVTRLQDAAPLVLALALGSVDPGSDAEGRLSRALYNWFAEERARHGKVRVRFTHEDTTARTVHAVGAFNDWRLSDEAWAFTRTPGTDTWELVVWLQPGLYPFKILSDGERWVGSTQPPVSPDAYVRPGSRT